MCIAKNETMDPQTTEVVCSDPVIHAELTPDSMIPESPECPDDKDSETAQKIAALNRLIELMSGMGDLVSDMDGEEDISDEEDDGGDFDDDDAEDEVDDEEDDDDEENCDAEDSDSSFGDAPVGKGVILRSSFKSNSAYCDAVVRSMLRLAQKKGLHPIPHTIREGVKLFSFDKTAHGIDVDGHILCEYKLCNFRIEFRINAENLPGRTPLIDYFCQDKNFPLRYGSVIMDHSDGEKKIEYSSCFYGAFSEEAFLRYWDALDATLSVYLQDFTRIASKKLNPEQRQLVRRMIGELSVNLSSRVKPENQVVFDRASEALGGSLSPRSQKLLNYLVEHAH